MVFCKIRAPLERLKLEAYRTEYMLPTDPKELRRLCEEGRENLWEPLWVAFSPIRNASIISVFFRLSFFLFHWFISHTIFRKIPDPDTSTFSTGDNDNKTVQTTMNPYDHIYLKYAINPEETNEELLSWDKKLEAVYKKWPIRTLSSKSDLEIIDAPEPSTESLTGNESGNPMLPSNSKFLDSMEANAQVARTSIFRGVDRMKLIYSIITNGQKDGCGLDIDRMLKSSAVLAFFPLHGMVNIKYRIVTCVSHRSDCNTCVL